MNMKSLICSIFAMTLCGCVGWDDLPNQDTLHISSELWDAEGVLSTQNGLYVPLTYSGGLARVTSDGNATSVDIGAGRLARLAASPDGVIVVGFVDRYSCEDDSVDSNLIADCPEDDLAVEAELVLIEKDVVTATIPVDSAYNSITFSDDGRIAIAYLDLSTAVDLSGVVSLNAIVVVDLNLGSATPVSVGFAADQVLYTYDEDGAADRAVVLSQSSVAVVNLVGDQPVREVTFPLTLDPDSSVIPVGVELTPDGRYALISVEGSADLYALDLENQSINIVELYANPSAMTVHDSTDQTVIVYGNSSVVDVMEHEFFDVESYQLDEPMNQIVNGSEQVLLYSDAGQHDLYRLDLVGGDLVEYRLQNPAISVHVAPTEEFAVVLTRAESGFGSGSGGIYDAHPGMEIIDLADDNTAPYLLEGEGLGVAFTQDETHLHALILQANVSYLYQLDLYTGLAVEIDLSSPPVAIGAIEDGPFFITHEDALGLISFLDPSTGEITEASGFGAFGIASSSELITNEEE